MLTPDWSHAELRLRKRNATAWANNRERRILRYSVLHATVHQGRRKRVLLLRQGCPFFLMRTIPILIVWRVVSLFRHQPAKRTFMHLCMCDFRSWPHVSRITLETCGQLQPEKKEKKLIRCLASRAPPQRSAGLAAFGPLFARWSLFALAAPSRSLMDICSELRAR